MKRILVITLALAIVLSMTACGGTGVTQADNTAVVAGSKVKNTQSTSFTDQFGTIFEFDIPKDYSVVSSAEYLTDKDENTIAATEKYIDGKTYVLISGTTGEISKMDASDKYYITTNGFYSYTNDSAITNALKNYNPDSHITYLLKMTELSSTSVSRGDIVQVLTPAKDQGTIKKILILDNLKEDLPKTEDFIMPVDYINYGIWADDIFSQYGINNSDDAEYDIYFGQYQSSLKIAKQKKTDFQGGLIFAFPNYYCYVEDNGVWAESYFRMLYHEDALIIYDYMFVVSDIFDYLQIINQNSNVGIYGNTFEVTMTDGSSQDMEYKDLSSLDLYDVKSIISK